MNTVAAVRVAELAIVNHELRHTLGVKPLAKNG